MGDWWMPEFPERKVSGILIINDSGKHLLKLNDHINNGSKSLRTHLIKILLGETKSTFKKFITLENIIGNNLFLEYDILSIYVSYESNNNSHFIPTDSYINSVTFTFDFLIAWMGGYQENPSDKTHTFRFNNINCLFNIFFKTTNDRTNLTNGKFLINQNANCEIQFTKPVEILGLKSVISSMRIFFSIIRLKKINYFDNVIIRINDNSTFKYYETYLEKNNVVVTSYWELLFHHNLINKTFGEVLTKWFETASQIYKPACLLYSTFNNNQYLEVEFNSLISGLEALDRNINNNKDDNYIKKLNRIISKLKRLDYEEKDEDINLIQSLNIKEVNLRKRIVRVINKFKDEKLLSINLLIGTPKDIKSFANKVVNTRNFLTHHDLSTQAETERFNLSEIHANLPILKLLLVFYLLEAINIDKEILNKAWWNIRSIPNANLQFTQELFDKVSIKGNEKPTFNTDV